jgi:hypothetical protein
MCTPAPTAQACWRDAQAFQSGLTFLGVCGDHAHSLRQSGHNCANTPGGNESPIGGVDYSPEFCHALDIGHGGDRDKAKRMREALLPDTRVRYVIDNAVGFYPPHRGGGTFTSSGHTDHLHVSFMPGSTSNVEPYFGGAAFPPIKWPLKPGDKNMASLALEVALVHSGFPDIQVDGQLGPEALAATKQMETFLKHKVREKVITRKDVQGIVDWTRFVGTKRPDYILTLGDHGPRVQELRANLRMAGHDVAAKGAYDTELQEAMAKLQRFFKAEHQAGNATRQDRQFVAQLAEGGP